MADWENVIVEENNLQEILNSSSDSVGSVEESDDSDFSDDLVDSDFEWDDIMFDQSIDAEIELVGETKAAKTNCSTNVGIHIREFADRSSSISLREKSIQVYQGNANEHDFQFNVGMCFNNSSEFRDAMRMYATVQGKPIKFTKNCSDKIQVTCDCGWVLFASFISKNEKTFQVKTIKGDHTCCRVPSSKHCSAKFLATRYEQHIRSNPDWPVNSMQEIMQIDNKTPLSIWKMYRAKEYANKVISGTEHEQYARLWDYCEEIRKTNPETTVKIKCKHDVASQTCIFKGFYICWGALKKGFMSGCRPIIGLDGTHLKTRTGGVLLCAVGIDGNNNMYPIAYAYVLNENTKTWTWFVSILIEDLCIENSHFWTIISDKQKGLIKAIEELLPNAEHRFCLRHMYNNFKQRFRGIQLKDLLWRAASATRVVDFNIEMEKLKACDQKAYEWVKDRHEKHWARSHFSTWPKCDMLLNNYCEAFNKVILRARDKPIITMLETIRVILMKRLHTQRDKILKSSGEICPSIQKIIENNKRNAHDYILGWNGQNKFEVQGYVRDKWTVDLGSNSCSCRRWDLTGIPCVHATACIFYRREKVEDFVIHWYKKEIFLRAYEHLLNPINSQLEWPLANLNPIVPWPTVRRKAGRPPQHARRMEEEELETQKYGIKRHGLKYSCSQCGMRGHNKRNCGVVPISSTTSSAKKLKNPVRRTD